MEQALLTLAGLLDPLLHLCDLFLYLPEFFLHTHHGLEVITQLLPCMLLLQSAQAQAGEREGLTVERLSYEIEWGGAHSYEGSQL